MSDQQVPPTQQQIDDAKWLEELKRRDANVPTTTPLPLNGS
jgi:hypothetical protein